MSLRSYRSSSARRTLGALGARPTVRRVRRIVLARNLRRLHDALAGTPLDGRYEVTGGVLLGWARQGRLLADDVGDADFVYAADDAPAFAAAVPVLVRAGFLPVARFRNNDGEIAEHRFVRGGARFDFFATWAVGGRIRYYMYDLDDELVCERSPQPSASFEFLGRVWRKPANHDRVLAGNYGDWRSEPVDWHFSRARTVILRRPARFGAEAWDVASG